MWQVITCEESFAEILLKYRDPKQAERSHQCPMGLWPDTQNCGLRMHRDCRERVPRQRLQREPLANDPGMHHGTCFKRVSWCVSGSLPFNGGGNVPGIPGACATRHFAYLVRGPCSAPIAYIWHIFMQLAWYVLCLNNILPYETKYLRVKKLLCRSCLNIDREPN